MEKTPNFAAMERKLDDIEHYITQLRHTINDKLFFLNKLDGDNYLFVDYGCADGSMIINMDNIANKANKKHHFIGYDIAEEMINIAKSKYNGPSHFDVIFTTDWNVVLERMNALKRCDKVLILSSVIHEVYSYGNERSIQEFWSRVLTSCFDYIVVRDMMLPANINRPTDAADLARVYDCDTTKPNLIALKQQIADFERIYGSLGNRKNFVHFLLKYRYNVNWNREVNENYFPISIEEFLDIMKSYYLQYFERFRLSYLDECLKDDFDLLMNEKTHIKAVFERVK